MVESFYQKIFISLYITLEQITFDKGQHEKLSSKVTLLSFIPNLPKAETFALKVNKEAISQM